ncbi:MAG TPA: alpha/beta family hydrolase [Luteolibacter sp.]|nr:alpha/beta family hydrolase [Luteolibacter sp.]
MKSTARESHVRIPCPGVWLDGDLAVPEHAKGLVVFAHGSGSGRMSPRNRRVAERMHESGLATLLFDLLTQDEAEAEEQGAMMRFDIPFLAGRLSDVIDWLREHPDVGHLGIGCFGASTGAAAALMAAASDAEIRAVVSRGGRTDLAGADARHVQAPVLLIVGSRDEVVLRWNHETMELLPGVRKLSVVQGASHLFEEPGTLDEAADLAADWFALHLPNETAPIT